MNTPSTIAIQFSYCLEGSMSLNYVTVAPPINNTVRAPAVRLRPSNSASPQLHSATLDSLVIRNPPLGINPCYYLRVDEEQSSVCGNMDATLEDSFHGSSEA